MSLLLNSQFIVDHLRLAMLSMQDPASGNVIVLNTKASKSCNQEFSPAALADATTYDGFKLIADSQSNTPRTKILPLAPATAGVLLQMPGHELKTNSVDGRIEGHKDDHCSFSDIYHSSSPPLAIQAALKEQASKKSTNSEPHDLGELLYAPSLVPQVSGTPASNTKHVSAPSLISPLPQPNGPPPRTEPDLPADPSCGDKVDTASCKSENTQASQSTKSAEDAANNDQLLNVADSASKQRSLSAESFEQFGGKALSITRNVILGRPPKSSAARNTVSLSSLLAPNDNSRPPQEFPSTFGPESLWAITSPSGTTDAGSDARVSSTYKQPSTRFGSVKPSLPAIKSSAGAFPSHVLSISLEDAIEQHYYGLEYCDEARVKDQHGAAVSMRDVPPILVNSQEISPLASTVAQDKVIGRMDIDHASLEKASEAKPAEPNVPIKPDARFKPAPTIVPPKLYNSQLASNQGSKSLLTAMFKTEHSQQNPFTATYSRFGGKNLSSNMNICIHMSFSNRADEAPEILKVSIARTATVDEVIGYTLYEWVESGRTPLLRSSQLDVEHWAMRIVEDDGTIDEDFPALERARPIHRFMSDAFALCETRPLPDSEHKTVDTANVTPTTPGVRASLSSGGVFSSTNTQEGINSFLESASASKLASAVPASAKLFIRVHLYSTIEVRHTTTLNVAPTTPLRTILEAVCKKRSVNPRDYVLKLADMQTSLLDLDKPFSSLGDIGELFLMKKSIGTSAGDMFLRPPGEEHVEAPSKFFTPAEFATASAYKKYTVVRKLNMFLGRQERVLAIDGEYIHLLPPENKQLFDTIKSSSYHVSTVVLCKQNKKLSSHLRLEIARPSADHAQQNSSSTTSNGSGGREIKTYDFEAASTEEAADICTQINLRIQMARKVAAVV